MPYSTRRLPEFSIVSFVCMTTRLSATPLSLTARRTLTLLRALSVYAFSVLFTLTTFTIVKLHCCSSMLFPGKGFFIGSLKTTCLSSVTPPLGRVDSFHTTTIQVPPCAVSCLFYGFEILSSLVGYCNWSGLDGCFVPAVVRLAASSCSFRLQAPSAVRHLFFLACSYVGH